MNDIPTPPPARTGDDMSALTDLAPDNTAPYVADENLINKGDTIDIRRKIPELKDIVIGAGWDAKMFEEQPLDIDLSCFLLNKDNVTREDEDFVFYNNETGCAGAVRFRGDSRTGAGDGDDECIDIDLNNVPYDVYKIVFTLTIYNAAELNQSFDKIRNMYLRMANAADQDEIFRFRLSEEEYAGQSAIKVGELVREGPRWTFTAIGESFEGGLAPLAKQYGLIIQM